MAMGIVTFSAGNSLAAAGAERLLAQAYPGRFLHGLGGHRMGAKAVSAMRDYLTTLDARLVEALVAFGGEQAVADRVRPPTPAPTTCASWWSPATTDCPSPSVTSQASSAFPPPRTQCRVAIRKALNSHLDRLSGIGPPYPKRDRSPRPWHAVSVNLTDWK
jgi:hypothetical protein